MTNHATTACMTAISCPTCGKKLRVPEGLKANAKVSCRSCGHVFRMRETRSPAQPTHVPVPSASEAAQTSGGSCSSAEPVRRRFRMTTTSLMLTSCLLVVVVGVIARRSADDGTESTNRTNTREIEEAAKTGGQEDDEPQLPAKKTTISESSFVVGATVLAYWPDDGYWYPAKIEKRFRDKFEIRHLDGTSVTVSAESLATENLREGDRISANWKGEGSYYEGKIASREENKLHISYDAGPEERTTLAAVRVQRSAPRLPSPQTFVDRYASEATDYYYDPTPSYAHQPLPTYSAPAYTPSYTPYTPSTPSYTPPSPQSGYSNGMSQNQYGMQQTDWSRKYP